MFQFPSCRTISTTVAVVFFCPWAAQAQSMAPQSTLEPVAGSMAATANAASTSSGSGNSAAKFASGTGNILFLAAGTLLPLLEDGPQGREHSLRTADSLLTSTLITEALKRIVRERRPDNPSERTSFPSGHATAAFAVAAMQSHFHPHQALAWYGGATAIAYSRVKLNRHYYRDVIAGAAVGYLTSRLEWSRPRGLILAPFIKSHAEGGSNGLSVSMNF